MNISRIQIPIYYKAQNYPPVNDGKEACAKTSKLTPKETACYSGLGIATLGIGTFFLLKGKNSVFKKIKNKQVGEILKKFKPNYTEAKTITEKELKNGNVRIEYTGKNFDGVILKDTLIFSKNGEIKKRILSEINEKTGEKLIKVYAGNSKILKSPHSFPKGEFDPNYFVKQFKKKPMKKEIHDKDNNYIYVQLSELIRPNGKVTEYIKQISPDNLPISLQINVHNVETEINKHNKHSFNWDTKEVKDTIKINYTFDNKRKLKAYSVFKSKADGKWLNMNDANITLNYINGQKGIKYITFQQMWAREKELGKAPNFIETSECHDALHLGLK